MLSEEMSPRQRSRVLPLEGGRNFRDLGGYATEDGRHVRWGVLFRSGSLIGLTGADWQQLLVRGVRVLCDLRTTREREVEPVALSHCAGVSYWSYDYGTSFAELRSLLRAGFVTGAVARQAMMDGFRELPFTQAPAHRQLFAYLKANHVPLIFNCVAGKDRTGTAAAVILRALGVPRATVVEDFALTNSVLDVRTIVAPDSSLAQLPSEVIVAVTGADPAYIDCALDSIDDRYGSVAEFLHEELDVSAQELQLIRDTLLE